MTKNQPRYSKIAIIGGGPSGLAAAKALALEPFEFETIDLHERRDKLGGLWYHKGNKSLIHSQIPNLNPNNHEIIDDGATKQDKFFSAIYKFMETNIIHRLMQYNEVPFPPKTANYPKRQLVFDYLENYNQSIPNKINVRLNSDITELKKVDNEWHLVSNDKVNKYDAIVLANGHFNTPFIPEVKGLTNWNINKPKTILHSKYFEDPNSYRDKTVLIIGNSASGVDISTQISTVAKKVIVSVRDLSNLDFENDLIKYIGLIEEYNWENSSVETKDEIIEGIDYVIFCTGYLYSFPFIKSDSVITNGRIVYNLYKQIFNIFDPSISYVGLGKNIVPMPLGESQSALIARVYSGRYDLPTTQEMKESYEQELDEKGESKFHVFGFPKDYEYGKHLQELIDSRDLRHPGLVAPIWDEQLIEDRSESKEAKNKRLQELVKHVKKLRSEGKDFELLDN
ncbi:FMO1 [Candida pseudojiufengensis]|uniref:FMO1 n=1 Tax=Candida pseudojiufengensis TaxID=497109 RepID=UPI00222416F7|nr:FMO1 [Candida pseudojiufengensis]KAI5966148.1 FMO1 [Candida pseudojiufengensis]